MQLSKWKCMWHCNWQGRYDPVNATKNDFLVCWKPLVWITKMCYNLSFTCRCYLGNWILCSYDEELKTSIFPISARWLSIEILFVGLQILLSSCFAVALCRKKRHVDCSVIWKSGSLCCRDTLYACIKIVTFT